MKTNIVPIEPATRAEYWAARVCKSHAASVEQIIQIGHELLEAKAKLPHGEWGRLTGETTRQSMLPFSAAAAQRLMAIAKHPTLSNPAHCAGFPASWYTLSELAKMPPLALEKHVAAGVIHPELTRAVAEQLVAEWRESAAPAKPEPLFWPMPTPAARTAPPAPPPMSAEEREELAGKLGDAVAQVCDEAKQSAAIKDAVRGVLAPMGAWAEVLGKLGAIDEMVEQLLQSFEDRLQPLPPPDSATSAKLLARLTAARVQLQKLTAFMKTICPNGEQDAHH